MQAEFRQTRSALDAFPARAYNARHVDLLRGDPPN